MNPPAEDLMESAWGETDRVVMKIVRQPKILASSERGRLALQGPAMDNDGFPFPDMSAPPPCKRDGYELYEGTSPDDSTGIQDLDELYDWVVSRYKKGMTDERDLNVLQKFGHYCLGGAFIERVFISSRGNEYFCEIDEDYLTDRFNLTGLNTEVQYYQYALDLVTDVFDLDCDDEMRETIEKSARHLYGLVHARYIVTTRGLAKMLEKYKKADFGKCPRVMCKSHPLLPMGQSDNPNVKAVKLYCAKCEDIYNPKSSRHSAIDGAYFGTSFHNIIFQVYPALIPPKSYDRYVPRIYGFKVHAPATLVRWQHGQRDDMRKRLRKLEIESGFKDEDEDLDAEESEEEEEDEEVDMDALENGEMEGGDLNNQV